MKFSTILSSVSLLAVSVSARPGAVPREHLLEKRQSGQTVLTNPQPASVQPRLEIRQLYEQEPDQWSLFIQALRWWQFESQNDPTSYYGVTSVHGVPRENYNNVPQCNGCDGADGYGAHNTILFPAWHRTYLAMFEQQFLKRAQLIANYYPADQQARMQAAAANLRWPYWDWAAIPADNGPALPTIVTMTQVTVNAASGQATFPNPLYNMQFQDTSDLVYYPFTSWSSTLRYPTSNDANAGSSEGDATNAFNNIRASLQDQLYQLFTTCTDYAYFSNDVADTSSTACHNSIEAIHNTVHSTAGGGGQYSGGHMTYLPLASFDPIFWLHHSMVDRVFAMWQAINPDSYIGSMTAVDKTWTIAPGSTQDGNSPLTPFYKDNNNNFWTGNDARYWASSFGYTYPEFVDSAGDRNAIISYVNNLYGPSATATAGSSKKRGLSIPGLSLPTSSAASAPSAAAAAPTAASAASNATSGSDYHYVANIQTPRYALNGSYNIFLFQGKPCSEEPSSFWTSPELIGLFGVTGEIPGHSMKEVIITNSIPLTRTLHKLVQGGLLEGLLEGLVTAWLKANLTWRIVGPDGCIVDPDSLPDFKVSVVSSQVTPPTASCELPTYAPFNILVDATAGLAGGLDATTKLLGDVVGGVAKGVEGVLSSL